jgi:hypothetical protein
MGDARTSKRRPRLRRRHLLVLGALAAALAIAVPVAWGAVFGDTTGNQFEADIDAIALAGITKGCTGGAPPNYCPADNVRRDAMAAFMHRGFGRVGFDSETGAALNGTDQVIATLPITVGLPSGATSGAAGFVKVDAEVRFDVTNATGCPCQVRAGLKDLDTDSFIDGLFYSRTVVDSTQNIMTIPVTGVGTVTTSGVHNYGVVAAIQTGTGSVNGSANLSAIYAPFGSTGTNTLGAARTASSHDRK